MRFGAKIGSALVYCVLLGASAVSTPSCSAELSSQQADLQDSFGSPTEHGELQFGGANNAAFTSSQRFHAWNFTLTKKSAIDISTAIEAENVDTVLYLYRRNDSGTWGSYVKKNDDDGGSITSRIKGAFKAGEYRVQVKAQKPSIKGAFSVNGACTGSGCPPQGGTCDPDEYAGLPTETGYRESCAGKVLAVIDATVTDRTTFATEMADRCTLPPYASRSVELYRDWWRGLYDHDPDEDEPSTYNIQATQYGNGGRIVEVDRGGDEDRLIFTFAANDNLIVQIHDEQSPTQGWFCGEQGEDEVEQEPYISCVMESLRALGHTENEIEDDGNGSQVWGDEGTAPDLVRNAIWFYGGYNDLAEDAVVEYSYEAWSNDYGDGARIVLYPEDDGSAAETFWAFDSGDDPWFLMSDGDESEPQYFCNSLINH